MERSTAFEIALVRDAPYIIERLQTTDMDPVFLGDNHLDGKSRQPVNEASPFVSVDSHSAIKRTIRQNKCRRRQFGLFISLCDIPRLRLVIASSYRYISMKNST